jgi:hypothetical protein
MRRIETEPLWRVMARARLERLDVPAVSPVVFACKMRAIAEAIPAGLATADDVRGWLEAEAARAERGHD